jgi:hypothetical protein
VKLASNSVLLVAALALSARLLISQGAPTEAPLTWQHVMYLGGHPDLRTPSRTWDNTLTVRKDRIVLKLHRGDVIEVNPQRITALAFEGRRYGKTFGQYVGSAVALGTAGVIATAIAANKKEHFVGIEYLLPDGRPAGLLLRLHKENYVPIGESIRRIADAKPLPE